MSPSFGRLVSVLLFVLYFGIEYLHWFSVEAISAYSIYIFELIWVALIWAVFKKIEFIKKNLSKVNVLLISILLPLGWLIHYLARARGIIIPFDFNSSETILFLLLVGPVLEELVFRGAMWRLAEMIASKPVFLILTTSLLFSYSHFQASFSVPDEYKPFIYYQTAYTFLLALSCARLRIQMGLLAAILGHALFNLGFWLGRG